MAKVQRLPNGNEILIREEGEEEARLEDLIAKATAASGEMRLANGNVFKRVEEGEAETAVATVEVTPPEVPTTKSEEDWTLNESPMTYLKHHGFDAPHSERALAKLGVTREEVEAMLFGSGDGKPEGAAE